MNTEHTSLSGPLTTWVSRLLVVLYVLLIVYPIVFVVLTSLKPTSEFFDNIWGVPHTFAWSNYARAWTDGGIGKAFFNSVLVVVVAVAGTLSFGALAGYALARLEIPRANLIALALVLMTMLPTESVLIPEYLLTSKLGLTGTRTALIITYIGWALPLTIFIFRGFFLTIPAELIEAARIDGAGELRTFYSVIIPLMLPPIATSAIVTFVGLWGELLWALVVLSNQAAIRTLPFSVVEFKGQYATDWGPLSAAVCIVVLPLVIFFLYTQKYFVQGLTSGAVKG
jgi:raffinose/stachyose/melibiose transport system permease protein